MEQQDIRWKQRFENYQQAVAYLKDDVEKYADTDLDIIKKGIIQSFGIAHELAWKVMQDYLKYQGLLDANGPRNVTRLAFQYELIFEGHHWMEMLNSRNMTVHTYDAQILLKEFDKIVHIYLPLFLALEKRMMELWQKSLD